jgi:hypothetical protein
MTAFPPFPAYQQSMKAIRPAMGAFRGPAPGTSSLLLIVLLLITPARYHRFKSGYLRDTPYLFVVVSQVKT